MLIRRDKKKNPLSPSWELMLYICKTLSPFSKRRLCAKFGWNLPRASVFSLFRNYPPFIKGRDPSVVKFWISFIQGWFVPSLVEVSCRTVALRKIFCWQTGLSTKIFPESYSSAARLKLAQWFWSKRFLNFVNVFLRFRNYPFPWNRAWPLI